MVIIHIQQKWVYFPLKRQTASTVTTDGTTTIVQLDYRDYHVQMLFLVTIYRLFTSIYYQKIGNIYK